jgi:hypothetical protein
MFSCCLFLVAASAATPDGRIYYNTRIVVFSQFFLIDHQKILV